MGNLQAKNPERMRRHRKGEDGWQVFIYGAGVYAFVGCLSMLGDGESLPPAGAKPLQEGEAGASSGPAAGRSTGLPGKCARDSMCSTKRRRKGRMGTGASGDNDAKRSEGHTALGAVPQHTKLAWLAEFPPIPSSSE